MRDYNHDHARDMEIIGADDSNFGYETSGQGGMKAKTWAPASLRPPLGARDLNALKRRARAGTGRSPTEFRLMALPGINTDESDISLVNAPPRVDSRRLSHPYGIAW